MRSSARFELLRRFDREAQGVSFAGRAQRRRRPVSTAAPLAPPQSVFGLLCLVGRCRLDGLWFLKLAVKGLAVDLQNGRRLGFVAAN